MRAQEARIGNTGFAFAIIFRQDRLAIILSFYISHCSRVAVSWSNVCALLWERTSLICALTA